MRQESVADGGDWGDSRDMRKETLVDVLAEMGRPRAFQYTHDMGDGWEHQITPGKPFELPADEDAVALLSAEAVRPDVAGRCRPDGR